MLRPALTYRHCRMIWPCHRSRTGCGAPNAAPQADGDSGRIGRSTQDRAQTNVAADGSQNPPRSFPRLGSGHRSAAPHDLFVAAVSARSNGVATYWQRRRRPAVPAADYRTLSLSHRPFSGHLSVLRRPHGCAQPTAASGSGTRHIMKWYSIHRHVQAVDPGVFPADGIQCAVNLRGGHDQARRRQADRLATQRHSLPQLRLSPVPAPMIALTISGRALDVATSPKSP
jgi:hypothetical protein